MARLIVSIIHTIIMTSDFGAAPLSPTPGIKRPGATQVVCVSMSDTQLRLCPDAAGDRNVASSGGSGAQLRLTSRDVSVQDLESCVEHRLVLSANEHRAVTSASMRFPSPPPVGVAAWGGGGGGFSGVFAREDSRLTSSMASSSSAFAAATAAAVAAKIAENAARVAPVYCSLELLVIVPSDPSVPITVSATLQDPKVISRD
jgi:hypothetical protein